MFCKYCGKKLESDATFCSGCGKNVIESVNNTDDNVEDNFFTDVSKSSNSLNAGINLNTLTGNFDNQESSTSNDSSIGFGNSNIDLFNTSSKGDSFNDNIFNTSSVSNSNFSNNQANSINQNINNNINSSVSSNSNFNNMNSVSNTNNNLNNLNNINNMNNSTSNLNNINNINNNSNTSNIDITKSSNKVFILIGVFIAIIMIFAIVCSVIGEDKLKNRNSNNTSVVEEKNTISYKGYKFNYPSGYKASIKDGVGIYLVGDVYAISIDIDNTNSYDSYLNLIKTTYPDQANDAELTISNRKFAGMVFESANKESICQYMSSTSNNTTFKGLIASKDKKFHSDAFNTLTSILDSATVDSKSVTNQTDTLTLYGDSDINSFTYNQ